MLPRRSMLILLAGAMIVGIAPMPYAYYVLLRLGVCMLFCVLIWSQHEAHGAFQGVTWMWLGFAVLYNPILPIHLGSKPVWVVVNLITISALAHGTKMIEGES
jgi:hypothetical protein